MGSSRLPGKALLSLGGRPMLSHVVERVCATRGVDETVLATSRSERDAALQAIAAQHHVRMWRGSEWDVLSRVREAARLAEADVVVRVTADCPLFCVDIAERVLDLYAKECVPIGYAWNDTTRSGYPDGTDVEVFSRTLLDRVDASPRISRTDREHVTPAIRRSAPRLAGVQAPLNLSWLKLSVDRPVDYDTVARVVEHIPAGDYSWDAVLRACVAAGIVPEGQA